MTVLSSVVGVPQPPSIDSRSAAAEALACFLAELTFCVASADGQVRTFKFNDVRREWPEPSKALDVPVATVLDMSTPAQDAWSLVPAPLEWSWDVFGKGTVLWKVAELVVDFQVDAWLGNEPERQAVAAMLPAAFSPSEDSFGVYVAAPDGYWKLPVRLSLLGMQRMDDAGSIYPRERRLMCKVRAEIAEVHLRCAPEFAPTVRAQVVQPYTERSTAPITDVEAVSILEPVE